jgi:hypothetical protein
MNDQTPLSDREATHQSRLKKSLEWFEKDQSIDSALFVRNCIALCSYRTVAGKEDLIDFALRLCMQNDAAVFAAVEAESAPARP